MRRLIKIALVILGIRAFMRWRKSRKQADAATAREAAADTADPADELRRKLAEAREEERAAAAPPDASVADRRAEVHEAGRVALDEMTSTDEA